MQGSRRRHYRPERRSVSPAKGEARKATLVSPLNRQETATRAEQEVYMPSLTIAILMLLLIGTRLITITREMGAKSGVHRRAAQAAYAHSKQARTAE
jgi:hypothetical protein